MCVFATDINVGNILLSDRQFEFFQPVTPYDLVTVAVQIIPKSL